MGFFDWFKKRKAQPKETIKLQQTLQPQAVQARQEPSLQPQENENSPLPSESQKPKEVFSHDKAEWQWDNAMEAYIAQYDLDEDWEPTEEEEDIIWSYAGLHIEMFLAWVIKHGLLSDFHMEDDADEVAAVAGEEVSVHSFFVELCDCTLSRDDVAEQLYGFLDAYYPTYITEFTEWLEKVRNKPALGTAFDWADYHAFEPVLDVAYRKYLEENHA